LGDLARAGHRCHITVATSTGHAASSYRLITTLLDPARYPATGTVTIYHQRWDIETAYLELRRALQHSPSAPNASLATVTLIPALLRRSRSPPVVRPW